MVKTFADLPQPIDDAISRILSRQEDATWVDSAIQLHQRYIERKKSLRYITSTTDSLGYLAMRAQATYAQVYGALTAVKELVPSWSPKNILDIGSGPGTAVWAAHEVWPSIHEATCVDENDSLLQLGKEINSSASVAMHWLRQDVVS